MDRTTLDMTEQRDIYIFKLLSEGDSQKFILQPPDLGGKRVQPFGNIAVVNRESSSIISEIAPYCTFEVYSPVDPWALAIGGAATAEKDNYILVPMNLYGYPENMQKVGDILDSRKVYLQEPDFRNMDLDYKNPHFIDLRSMTLATGSDSTPLVPALLHVDFDVQHQEALDERRNKHISLNQKVASAFNSTTRAQTLKRISADSKILTELQP